MNRRDARKLTSRVLGFSLANRSAGVHDQVVAKPIDSVPNPDSIGVLARTKTGRLTDPSNRSARTYHVAIRDDAGTLWTSKLSCTSQTQAIMKTVTLAQSEGKPSTWDADVLPSHYVRCN